MNRELLIPTVVYLIYLIHLLVVIRKRHQEEYKPYKFEYLIKDITN